MGERLEQKKSKNEIGFLKKGRWNRCEWEKYDTISNNFFFWGGGFGHLWGGGQFRKYSYILKKRHSVPGPLGAFYIVASQTFILFYFLAKKSYYNSN